MHIAIKGMDGVGKTSQAKAVAEKLNFAFIEKAFHEMFDGRKWAMDFGSKFLI